MATWLISPAASASPTPEPHIILVGLPGAGKSTVGAGVARAIERPFVDLDQEIEARAALSVPAIFRERGEAHFRALEAELSAEVAGGAPAGLVLAPGGGWIGNALARAPFRDRSRLVYLRIRPEVALARVRADHQVRPLLAVDDPLAAIRRLLTVREQEYLEADEIVDVDLLEPQEVISIVASRALAWRAATA